MTRWGDGPRGVSPEAHRHTKASGSMFKLVGSVRWHGRPRILSVTRHYFICQPKTEVTILSCPLSFIKISSSRWLLSSILSILSSSVVRLKHVLLLTHCSHSLRCALSLYPTTCTITIHAMQITVVTFCQAILLCSSSSHMHTTTQ